MESRIRENWRYSCQTGEKERFFNTCATFARSICIFLDPSASAENFSETKDALKVIHRFALLFLGTVHFFIRRGNVGV